MTANGCTDWVQLVALAGIAAIGCAFGWICAVLEARMYRASRNRWRDAFWKLGPAIRPQGPVTMPEDEE